MLSNFKEKLIRFFMTISAILVIDLCVVYFNRFVISFQSDYNRFTVTLLVMLAVLCLFYVLLTNFEKLSQWGIKTFMDLNKILVGRTLGLYVGLFFLYLFMYAAYYYALFSRNFFTDFGTRYLNFF